MTARVYSFERPAVEVPHVTGQAACLDCKHEWTAVIEQSAFEESDGWLECPACALERGRLKYAHQLPPGSQQWQCKCENTLFNVTPSGIHCPNCGRMQEFP